MIRLITICFLVLILSGCASAPSVSPGSGSGKGGSTARFTIAGDYLYVVKNESLTTYDIHDPTNPTTSSQFLIGLGNETIFPYGNYIFIGTTTGVKLFSLDKPTHPRLVTTVQHISSCDPVVVQNDIAYVTLRTGMWRCPRGVNQLEILDFKNVEQPKVLAQFPMNNPNGLGIDGEKLFLCDGDAGLKVFDVSQTEAIEKLDQHKDVLCHDLIPFQGVVIVTGEKGVSQYDYKTLPLNRLSHIPVGGRRLTK